MILGRVHRPDPMGVGRAGVQHSVEESGYALSLLPAKEKFVIIKMKKPEPSSPASSSLNHEIGHPRYHDALADEHEGECDRAGSMVTVQQISGDHEEKAKSDCDPS